MSNHNDPRGEFADGSLRIFTAYEGSTPLLSVVPHRSPLPDPMRQTNPNVPVRLSRFAYLRRVGTTMRLETPRSAVYAEILDPRVGALVAGLSFDLTPRELAVRTGLALDSTCACIGLLESMGAIAPADRPGSLKANPSLGGVIDEDVEIPQTWEFHDLLFHSRVRAGRQRQKLGRSTRFGDIGSGAYEESTEPLPGDVVLPRVDIANAVASDRPFGEVLRSRSTDRDWSGPDLQLSQVSELLARVCESFPRKHGLLGDQGDGFGRTYPSGGSVYETDLVIVPTRVTGLPFSAYLYRPHSHSLSPLRGSDESAIKLLYNASEATGGGVSTPQALVVCAARFPDLAIKYEGIAYSLMLKHVGILMATVAYTASAMGLGCAVLGTGNSDDFAAATGLDYYRHGSVGEMTLSVPPA